MNAEQVARVLGISGKTVLRHVAKGTIVATRKHAQELLIAEDQVEILRQALLLEKSKRLPGISQDMSGQIANLEQRVAELEEKVRALESGQMSSHVSSSQDQSHEKPQERLYPYIADKEDSTPQQEPQKRTTQPSSVPADVPPDAMPAHDFADVHNVNRNSFKRHCAYGVKGDRFKVIEVDKVGARKGDKERWLSQQQQREATAFWRRNKVAFSRCDNAECACQV